MEAGGGAGEMAGGRRAESADVRAVKPAGGPAARRLIGKWDVYVEA